MEIELSRIVFSIWLGYSQIFILNSSFDNHHSSLDKVSYELTQAVARLNSSFREFISSFTDTIFSIR